MLDLMKYIERSVEWECECECEYSYGKTLLGEEY